MLEYAISTSSGGREINEDSAVHCESGGRHCFVVCDGLGGHGMGDRASRLVTDVFKQQLESGEKGELFLKNAFQAAQDALMKKQKELNVFSKMKTTATALLIEDNTVYYGHVGDSRIYFFFGNRVKCRTRDHSVPEMLVRMGEIREDEIRFHSDRNKLVRAMGIPWEKPMYQLGEPMQLSSCQAFLLCSDGFWELIDEREMSSILSRSCSAEDWLRQMNEVIQTNGKNKNMDNYTAIAIYNG